MKVKLAGVNEDVSADTTVNLYPPHTVFNAVNVFKQIAVTAFEKRWYEECIKLFNIIECLTQDNAVKAQICVYKSLANKALANMVGSKHEALKAVEFNEAGDLWPYFNMGSVMYNENEFEEGVKFFMKGMKLKRNAEFRKGIGKAVSALEHSVGAYAGGMFDKEVLGLPVERFKQEEIGLAPPPKKDLTYNEQHAREMDLLMKKRLIAKRYLTYLTRDRDFLEKFQDELLNTNPNVGFERIRRQALNIIADTLEKIDLKIDAKWHRKPLYSFFNCVRAFETSDYAKKVAAHKRHLRKQGLYRRIGMSINNLIKFRDAKDSSHCYGQMLKLRDMLKFLTDKQFESRASCIEIISNVMGDIYMLPRRLLPNVSPEFNDLRVEFSIGVYRSHWPTGIEEVHHVNVLDPQNLKKIFEHDLNETHDELEKAFLNYEVASIIGMRSNTGEKMRKFCLDAIAMAKRVENVQWFLNSVFLLARSAFTGHRYNDGRTILLAAKEASQNYSKLEMVHFIDRALLLVERRKPSNFIKHPDSDEREQKLHNQMFTLKQKDRLINFIHELNELPEWGRTPLPSTSTAKTSTKQKKSVMRMPVEKMTAIDQLLFKNNWITGFDDQEPYHMEDLRTPDEIEQIRQSLYTDPRYEQFLTLEGEVVDYEDN